MSGHSSSTPCPNCNKDADLYTDWKPYDYSIINCPYCGLVIGPVIEYMSLQDLNTWRKEQGLSKLRKLPKQEFNG